MTTIVAATRPSYSSGTRNRMGRIKNAMPPSMRKSTTGPKRYLPGVAASPAEASTERSSAILEPPSEKPTLASRSLATRLGARSALPHKQQVHHDACAPKWRLPLNLGRRGEPHGFLDSECRWIGDRLSVWFHAHGLSGGEAAQGHRYPGTWLQ